MNPCNEIHKKLILYIEDELSAQEKYRVENHLSHCTNCQQELAALRKVMAALPIEKPVIPENYGNELIVSINEELESRKSRNRKLIPALSMIAVAVVFLIVAIAPFQSNPSIVSEELALYEKYASELLLTDIDLFSETFEESPDLMPGEYYEESTAYLLEATSRTNLDDYEAILSVMDENKFDDMIETLTNLKI